jgi:hypothetical protein
MMTLPSYGAVFRVLARAAVLLLSAGCAPRVVLQAPAEWPAEWAGRKIYHTPRAYVYAGAAVAAGEADDLVNRVAIEFERDNAEKPVKGLLIVNDRPGESPVAGWRDLLRLTMRQQAAETQPASMPAEDIEKKLEKVEAEVIKAEAEMARIGMSLDLVLSMSAVPLAKGDIPRVLNLPENVTASADWAVIFPSRSLLASASDKMMHAALQQQKRGLVEQAMLVPLLAIVQPIMVDALAAQRDLGVYRAFVYAQPGWTVEHRRQVYKQYSDRRQKKITNDMEAGVKNARKKPHAATRPGGGHPGPATSQATKEGPASSQATTE